VKTIATMVGSGDSNNLGVIAEKLKALVDETQENYESFIDASQLYKKGSVNQKDFLAKVADYLAGMTSLSFLAIRVLFEVESEVNASLSKEHGTPPPFASSRKEKAGMVEDHKTTESNLDTAQERSRKIGEVSQKPSFQNDVVGDRTKLNATGLAARKNCIICGSYISETAKFCNKCGNSQ
jgi:hypothetical protein